MVERYRQFDRGKWHKRPLAKVEEWGKDTPYTTKRGKGGYLAYLREADGRFAEEKSKKTLKKNAAYRPASFIVLSGPSSFWVSRFVFRYTRKECTISCMSIGEQGLPPLSEKNCPNRDSLRQLYQM